MRVAHVNDIAFVASTLAGAQSSDGVEAVVFDPSKHGGSLGYPLKVLSLPLRFVPLLRLVWQLRRGRFDIVHIHYATHGVIGLLAGAPFLIHCHGSDVRYVDRRAAKGRALAWVMRRAAAVLYATPDLANWVLPLRADAEFLPNPIDIARFRPGQGSQRDVLLGVRLHPIKGAETAIEAVARLLQRRPATTVTVIEDGPLALEASRRLHGLVETVPRQTHERMPWLLNRHRIAVGQFRLGILSQHELEAMACGVPVVTDFRYPEVYDSPPPVLQAASAELAVERLEELLGNRPVHAKFAAASRHWVASQHGSEAVGRALLRIYARSLKDGRYAREQT